jgi:putative ABC transport system ATP-binding protein
MSEAAYIVRDLSIERRHSDCGFRLDVPEFRVARGEFVAIVGATGCGKSTLLDILALILRPDRAERFEFVCPSKGPRSLTRMSGWQRNRIRREALGYVLQTGGLLSFLSVRENILLSAKLKGGIRNKRRRLRDLAARLGILDQLSKNPQALSGGQRQRVSIARALIHDPVIVLADEPTASVDGFTAKKIVDEFKRLATSRGAAVVMVTHDTRLVAPPVCDRAYTFDVRRDPDGVVVSRCLEVASWRSAPAK